MGSAVHVISEGLNGRTTVLDDPTDCDFCGVGGRNMNGRRYLTPCPPGSHSTQLGQSRCTTCPAGTFMNDDVLRGLFALRDDRLRYSCDLPENRVVEHKDSLLTLSPKTLSRNASKLLPRRLLRMQFVQRLLGVARINKRD